MSQELPIPHSQQQSSCPMIEFPAILALAWSYRSSVVPEHCRGPWDWAEAGHSSAEWNPSLWGASACSGRGNVHFWMFVVTWAVGYAVFSWHTVETAEQHCDQALRNTQCHGQARSPASSQEGLSRCTGGKCWEKLKTLDTFLSMHLQVTFLYSTVIYICYYVSLLCIL